LKNRKPLYALLTSPLRPGAGSHGGLVDSIAAPPCGILWVQPAFCVICIPLCVACARRGTAHQRGAANAAS
jgi:hypothetical protein